MNDQRIFYDFFGMVRGVRQDSPHAEMYFPKLSTRSSHAPDAIYHIIVREEAQLSRLPLFSSYKANLDELIWVKHRKESIYAAQ